ncbi:MAG: outer membrane beta-barrel protein [Coraliomargarita sp.]
MTTAHRILFATAPLLMFAPAFVHASPLVSIGDHADLFFNGSSSVRWTSNLFRDEDNEEEDIVYTVQPGFELNVGRGLSSADFSVITSYEIRRYDDYDDLDTELFHIAALGSYKGSRLDLSGRASFDEVQTTSGNANVDGDLIESERTAGGLNAEYRYSPKFSLGSGVSYSKTDYQNFTENFSDRESLSIPLDLYYELTPKVDLSVGYAYSNQDVDGRVDGSGDVFDGYDFDSHFFNVGARGQLLPKLGGYFKIGYRYRDSYTVTINDVDLPEEDSSGMLGLDADLTWAATQKLVAKLAMSRDFGASGEGDGTENTSVNSSLSYSINPYWSASSYLRYTLREYDTTDREDDQYGFGLRANYTPNRYWAFSGGYAYQENDSNLDDQSYEDHRVDVRATFRY